jgi:hypothetical protein
LLAAFASDVPAQQSYLLGIFRRLRGTALAGFPFFTFLIGFFSPHPALKCAVISNAVVGRAWHCGQTISTSIGVSGSGFYLLGSTTFIPCSCMQLAQILRFAYGGLSERSIRRSLAPPSSLAICIYRYSLSLS